VLENIHIKYLRLLPITTVPSQELIGFKSPKNRRQLQLFALVTYAASMQMGFSVLLTNFVSLLPDTSQQLFDADSL
jgi:hypothetical protein